MQDIDGKAIKRNFIHVDDLVKAIIQAILLPDKSNEHTFNISMDSPVDYGEVSKYLKNPEALKAYLSKLNITQLG